MLSTPVADKYLPSTVVSGVFIIGLLVAYDDPALGRADGTALSSPFVIAIDRAGINALPSIANAAFLCSATSAASSGLVSPADGDRAAPHLC